MKIIINIPGLLMTHDGAARVFTTDGKPTYGNNAVPCYFVKELDTFIPVERCLGSTK